MNKILYYIIYSILILPITIVILLTITPYIKIPYKQSLTKELIICIMNDLVGHLNR